MIRAIRGMKDILPPETSRWQWVEARARETFELYGYQEIRLPLLERTELFARSIGADTDIVAKEMYTFTDRRGDSLTLRPEATAQVVRACLENGLMQRAGVGKFYLIGPMFRYERPQKGRYRQFHQIDVEALGFPGPDVDAELILMSARIWGRLGLRDLVLNLNSLGTPESRQQYRVTLVQYFRSRYAQLDEDSRRRLEGNPLRILDSKNPEMQELISAAPRITDHLDEESQAHFDGLRACLDDAGLAYQVNPRLVRGLDYYSRTVFEWVTGDLGAQDAVCSGGRYDGLVAQLGGQPCPAIGWALGVERIVELMRVQELPGGTSAPQVYLVLAGPEAERRGLRLAEQLRDELPDAGIESNCGGGSFKSQLKRADRSGARFALILGADELEQGVVTLKSLREDVPQRSLRLSELAGELRKLLGQAGPSD